MKLTDFAEKLKKKQKDDSLSGNNFRSEIFMNFLPPAAIIWTITLALCFLLGDIPTSAYLDAIAAGIFFCYFIYCWLVFMGNIFVSNHIGENIVEINTYESTVRERTKLLKQIVNLPITIGIICFLFFIACGAVWLAIVADHAQMDTDSVLLCAFNIYLGAYFLFAYLIIRALQKVCSRYAYKIAEKGISNMEIEKYHSFGLKSKVLAIISIFLPIVFIALNFYVLAWRAYESNMPVDLMLKRLIVVGGESALFYLVFARVVFNKMMRTVHNMKNILGGMNKENLHKVQYEKTDLSNEFMYNIHLINTILGILQKILKESQKISMDVIESSNELSVISRETAVTSLEQNSGIKELLSAMEETDALSKNIAEKIGEVSIVAKKTTGNIMDGFGILKQNMQKLDEIKAANDITVEGIKKLTEKISGISDIARTINGIADQTNIIAFNAELEASSAGDVGENFSLVANEIRRLTNSTIQSTEEIRKRIIEIQHSSDELLLSSQNGMKKIVDGNQIINELNARFEELKQSSESMDYASEDIKKIIEQQTASFAQIVVTLQQIAQTTESFSSSTQKISDSAQHLCTISESLKKLQPEEE